MSDTEARVIVMVRWTDKYADRQIDRKFVDTFERSVCNVRV